MLDETAPEATPEATGPSSVGPEDALRELGEHIAQRRPDCVLGWHVRVGELTIEATLSSLRGFIEFLKFDSSCRFSQLVDLTAVDNLGREKRFDVVYHFLSMHRNHRVRVKVRVREEEMVPSIIAVHPSAGWFEREVFDMFGLLFSGHPDLRRILTDYGFRGHPLRKDFPTTGYTEVRYDEAEKRVVYEPVHLVQEYRQFDFMSPWEGADYVLPGRREGGEVMARHRVEFERRDLRDRADHLRHPSEEPPIADWRQFWKVGIATV